MTKAVELLERLEMPPVSVKTLLLEPNSVYLEDELAECTDKMKEKPGDWANTHLDTLRSKGLGWSALSPPTAMQSNPWFANTLCPREKQVLIYNISVLQHERKLLSVDVSQRIDRCPKGWDDELATVVPRAKVWLVDEERLLTGWESMRVQGFPKAVLERALSAGTLPGGSDLRDLAGNAFSSTTFAACYMSLLANLPSTLWKDSAIVSHAINFNDVASAMLAD